MQKKITFDDVTKENIKDHNPNSPKIPNHPCKILIVQRSVSEEKNSLFYLISQEPGSHEICLYAKDPFEAKHQFLINRRESAGLKHFNDSKAFVKYANNM